MPDHHQARAFYTFYVDPRLGHCSKYLHFHDLVWLASCLHSLVTKSYKYGILNAMCKSRIGVRLGKLSVMWRTLFSTWRKSKWPTYNTSGRTEQRSLSVVFKRKLKLFDEATSAATSRTIILHIFPLKEFLSELKYTSYKIILKITRINDYLEEVRFLS